MTTTITDYIQWLQSLPIKPDEKIEIESLVHSTMPSTAKRVICYRYKEQQTSRPGLFHICVNSMGTHITYEFNNEIERIGQSFQP